MKEQIKEDRSIQCYMLPTEEYQFQGEFGGVGVFHVDKRRHQVRKLQN